MAFDGTLKFDTAIDKAGFHAGLSGLGDIAKSGLSGIGKIAKAGMAAVTGAVTAASGAVALLGKQAVESYADFEQLAGGVETLFGDAAQTVMNNAAQAFRTAGMSANEYMETATASAAAMVSSLAGDTQLAAKLMDMAVTDMSDNINKMGSSAESVQNAYAGFAKGNFTMLDNLKLGYGGTKQEMERLLETAEKLTGVKYNIDSYADIVRAIHAVQVEMGVAGTTAKEASETISGSVGMVKAAWSNLLIGIADDTQDFDKLTDDLVNSVDAAAKNILPRAEVAVGGVVRLVDGLSDDAVRLVTDLAGYAPMAADAGLRLMDAFSSGIREHLPELLDTGMTLGLELINGFGDLTVNFLELGAELAEQLDTGIEQNLPRITGTAREVVLRIIKALGENGAAIFGAGAGILEMLLNSLSEDMPRITVFVNTAFRTITAAMSSHAPNLVGMAALLISQFAGALTSNLSSLLDCAVQIMNALISGIQGYDVLPELIAAAVLIVRTLGTALLSNAQPLLDAGISLIAALIAAITEPDAFAGLLDMAVTLVTSLADMLMQNLSPLLGAVIAIIAALGTWLGEHALDLVDAGLFIVQAVVDAVLQNLPLLLDAAVQIIEGLCRGIEEDSDDVLIAIEQIIRTLLDFLLSPDTIRMVGQAGGKIIRALIPAAKELAADLLGFAYDLFTEYGEALLTPDWDEIGKNIVYGILDGLLGVDFDAELFKSDFAENWVSGIKDIFGIHSPSKLMRDQIGKNLALGIEVGFEENVPDVSEMIGTNIKAPEFGIPEYDEITVSLTDDAARVLEELRAAQIPVTANIDPAALETLRMSPMPDASALVPQSATSIVNNSYQYNSSSSTTNSTTTNNTPDRTAPTGDITVNVHVGEEKLETVVLNAIELANSRSGGDTV